MVVGLAGNADSAGLRDSFEARCDVHAVTVDVVSVDNNVAEMHAYPQQHPVVIARAAIAYLHLALDLGRAFHGFDHAAELGQDAVAHKLYDSPAIPFDCRRDQFAAVGLERGERAGFICAHKPAVAGDIRGEDSRQPPFDPRLGHKDRP